MQKSQGTHPPINMKLTRPLKKKNKPRLANPSIVVKYALLEGAVSPVYSMGPPSVSQSHSRRWPSVQVTGVLLSPLAGFGREQVTWTSHFTPGTFWPFTPLQSLKFPRLPSVPEPNKRPLPLENSPVWAVPRIMLMDCSLSEHKPGP